MATHGREEVKGASQDCSRTQLRGAMFVFRCHLVHWPSLLRSVSGSSLWGQSVPAESTNVQPAVWVGEGSKLVKEARSSDVGFFFFFFSQPFTQVDLCSVQETHKDWFTVTMAGRGHNSVVLRYAKVCDGICQLHEWLRLTPDAFQHPLKPDSPAWGKTPFDWNKQRTRKTGSGETLTSSTMSAWRLKPVLLPYVRWQNSSWLSICCL